MISFEAQTGFELYMPEGVVEVEPGDVIVSDFRGIKVYPARKALAVTA